MENMKNLIKEYADLQYPFSNDYNTKRYGNDRMNEYIRQTIAGAVKTSSGLICGFDKPRIDKDFCFHDEGPQYELYKELHADQDRMKNYFLYQNLREIDDNIQAIENPESCSITRVYGFYKSESGACSMTWRCYSDLSNNSDIKEGIQNHEKEPNFEPMTESDKVQVLAVLKQIRTDFEKRLNTWWKKYGFEKLHTWTYWADA